MSTPSGVAIAQIGAAILSPIIGALTAIFTLKHRDKDTFVGSIDWIFDYEPDAGAIELPFLLIHNRSPHSIHVTSLEYRRGVGKRSGDGYTALPHEDPIDLNFPYEIEPGKTRRFILDEDHAVNAFGASKLIDKVGGLFGRAPFVVEVRTMSGRKKVFDAVRALPYKNRPDWAK